MTEDRIVPMKERDGQTCEALVAPPDSLKLEKCGAELVRDEIPASQAKLSYNWGEWAR